MYATTVMVIVAMATADVERGEQIFLLLNWGKEVSPSGGGHLSMKSEEDTTLDATLEGCR